MSNCPEFQRVELANHVDFAEASPGLGVVAVSARGSVKQRVEGLIQGADVCLSKPVDLSELSGILRRLTKQVRSKLASLWSVDAQTWREKAPCDVGCRRC